MNSSKRLKYLGVSLFLIILLIVVVSIYHNLTQVSQYSILYISNFSKIEDIIALNTSTLFIVGSKTCGNISHGVAGYYYLNDNEFKQVNLSKLFCCGAIYSVAYNGSALMLAGACKINGVLHPAIALISNNKVTNLTSYIPRGYYPGRALVVAWFNKTWFIGGNFLFNLDQHYVSVMFLIGLKGNSTINLTLNISNILNQLPEGCILSLSVGHNCILIGGKFVIYLVLFKFNSTSIYVINTTKSIFKYPGFIISLSQFNSSTWVVGGEYFPVNSTICNPYLVLYNSLNSCINYIKLNYTIGFVTSVSSYNGNIVVSLRVPFKTPQGVEGGTVILEGKINALKQTFDEVNISINQLLFLNNRIIGGGYKVTGNADEGILIFLNEN
jgi:hypothetical protein